MFMHDKEIALINRALGIIEGIALLMPDDTSIRTSLFIAVDLVEQAMAEDGKHD